MAERPILWHTRPRDDSTFFANELAPYGIDSIIGPVLHIAPKPIPQLYTSPTALLITSRHATHALAVMPAQWRTLPAYCVGHATARAVADHGLTHIISGKLDVQSLLPRLAGELPSGSNLLYFAGDETRPEVKTMLGARGITVTMVVVYHAMAEHHLSREVGAALAAGTINAVALFSPRTARITCDLMEKAGLADAARTMTAYCFSANVAQDAARLPWASIQTCSAPNRRAMRELIVSHSLKPL
jgi:uroporphyrinogen-III synthase